MKKFLFIHKQLQKLVSAGVGQPQNLAPPASLNFLSLAASAPASLGEILGASLAYSQFLKSFVYILALFFAISLQGMSRLPPQSGKNMGVRSFTFEDHERHLPVAVELWYPTDQNGPFAEPPDAIWIHPKEIRDAPLSARANRYPLILMSHGYKGERRDCSWLAEFLAKNGYIVASVDHFGSSRSTYDPLLSLKFWERPRDIAFALTAILEEKSLKGRVDNARVGFVGYSLGGMTGLSLGGAVANDVKRVLLNEHSRFKDIDREVLANLDVAEGERSYYDQRIKAFLLICPANFVYPPESLKLVRATVGLVATLHDEVLPYDLHAHTIIEHVAPSKLKLLKEKVSHLAFVNRITKKATGCVNPELVREAPHPDVETIHKEVGAFALDFFANALK